MSNAINKAWELFFEGKIAEAKQLVEEAYQVETCAEYPVLNLFAYLYLEEKNGEQAFEQSITAFEEAGDDIGVREVRELMTTYQII